MHILKNILSAELSAIHIKKRKHIKNYRVIFIVIGQDWPGGLGNWNFESGVCVHARARVCVSNHLLPLPPHPHPSSFFRESPVCLTVMCLHSMGM